MKVIITEEQRRMLNEVQQPHVERLDHIFFDYYGQGSFDGIYIPKIADVKFKWLFYQIIELINDLRANSINTSDFLNTSNWGLKPDGSLCMFDLGFGNYFEQFEKEPENMNLNEDSEIITKLRNKLGIKSSTFVGSGHFGHAHDIGDGRIMKLTKDRSEAINSQRIIGKDIKHIAKIYDVKWFDFNGKKMYLILLEKVKLDPNVEKLYRDMETYFWNLNDRHFDKKILDMIKLKHPLVGDFLIDMCKMGYSLGWEKYVDKIREQNEFDFNDISEVSQWIRDSRTNDHDIDEEPPKHVKQLVAKLIK